ncbi:Mu transposase domain-containing protein [Streptomyces sp. NRRL S-378]|uniref:Mu transposase domain-containing protein n=1 Tax=Streptomyces sp. NRRL S-378 TaxID=1463904 RepID=UPI003B637F5A
MLQLPPISPPGWGKASLRLPRDHYVRLDTCGYSVHPLAIGRRSSPGTTASATCSPNRCRAGSSSSRPSRTPAPSPPTATPTSS